MPEIQISSDDWLAISRRNGTIGLFSLRNRSAWQCLRIEDEQINDLHRNLLKFSPNGQIFVCNGQSRQLVVYIQSDWTKTNVWWEIQRKIVSRNLPLSIELTNKTLFIADIDGDIYRIDLTSNEFETQLILSSEYCIMKNSSMSLEIVLMQINEKNSFLITPDQNDRIRLSHYPNTSDIAGYCHGHTEFISHIKIIDTDHIISASADGTIRLWRVPACVPLVLLHSRAFILFSKEVYCTDMRVPENSREEILTSDILSRISSMIDYSIWKMDVISSHLNIIIAFSIYIDRFHSIYLTDLENMKQLTNEQRKLTFDSHYGAIVDFCLIDSMTNSNLYVLFDRNIVVQMDVGLMCHYKHRECSVFTHEIINEINVRLIREEFNLHNYPISSIQFDEMIFGQGLKNAHPFISEVNHKRKVRSPENEQRKKAIVIDDDDNIVPGEECS